MSNSQPIVIQRQDNPDLAKVKTCSHCKNHYIVLWLNQAADWSDFGYRHCPFCGWAFDEATGAVMV